MEHHGVMTGQDIYCTHTHTNMNVRIPARWQKWTDTSVCAEIKTSKNDCHQGPSKTHHREHYLTCTARMMRCYRLHNLTTNEHKVMFWYLPKPKGKKKIWEPIGNMFKCPAWSIHLRRKFCFKLWKQSVALKKHWRHNWKRHPAQKPAGNPPYAPWCQQWMIPVCGTKIITKVWGMRTNCILPDWTFMEL